MDEDEIKIVTDGKPRELNCFMDLTEKERADFDYIDDEEFYSQRFVKYKGCWYDVDDTQRIGGWPKQNIFDFSVNPGSRFAGWGMIKTETFFSGVLFRYTKDFKSVVCGRYCT